MNIGVPAETKTDEYRVALTPAGAREAAEHGHNVFIETGAGRGAGFDDRDYVAQGARVSPDAAAVFAEARLILKVKEPQPDEVSYLDSRHLLFTFLHLAPAEELTAALLNSGATCIAYETVEDARGRLPLLAPMSEVAGKIAAQEGASILKTPQGGPGKLIGGVPGVAPARVVIIGGGVVGRSAAVVAAGLGADVVILDRDVDRLRELDAQLGRQCSTVYASSLAMEEQIAMADLVIGAVLIRGARAPRVLTRQSLAEMRCGAVIVDVSIDQGGCFETSRPTTHSQPTYTVDGVTHYCVANMPGAVPVTSTQALTNATLPYVLRLADLGYSAAIAADPGLRQGVTLVGGKLTNASVAESQGRDHCDPMALLSAQP